MDVSTLVREHYSREDLLGVIYRALADAGVDVDALTVDDLAPVDQLHAGFLPATLHLLEQLDLDPATRLLDVGCGLGGPARVAAQRYGCAVVGIDLSAPFVEAGLALTEAVGLSGLVSLRVARGDALEVPDASFDRAMLVHVGMNVEDKAAVFAEVRRVLRPGGLFVLYEQMLVGDGEPRYPLPWAEDARSSFVASPAAYGQALATAGFDVERTEDRTPTGPGPHPAPGPPSPLSPAAVFGPGFTERLANNVAATRARILAPTLVVARAR